LSKKEKDISQHQLYTIDRKVWRKLKKDNEFSPEYLSRVKKINRYSRLTQPLQKLQKWRFQKKINQLELSEDPIFILGHWRSGTTHLHYTLSQDKRLGYLNNHQAYIYNLALLSPRLVRKITARFFPETRPQDNIKMSPEAPAEEEQPLSCTSHRTGIHHFWLPKNRSYFDRYNLFENITDNEYQLWKNDYHKVVQGIAFYNKNKPLLLKNPHNTGRVKALLELYPKAKFIFIHRSPEDVYRSTMHLFNKLVHTQFLQSCSEKELEEMVLYNFVKTLQKYLSERQLIPEGKLIEISFDELEEDGFKTVKSIYSKLDLPHTPETMTDIKGYLDGLKSYKKNKFEELPAPTKAKLKDRWSFYYDAFSY
jgi:hypothetical protein